MIILFSVPLERIWRCPTCFIYTGSKSNVIAHMSRVHGPSLFPWVCGICDLSYRRYFRDAIKMRQHWREFHHRSRSPAELLHPKLGNHWTHFPFSSHYDLSDSDE